jgi:hypothetical protein
MTNFVAVQFRGEAGRGKGALLTWRLAALPEPYEAAQLHHKCHGNGIPTALTWRRRRWPLEMHWV